jgi:hypothetical protein
LQVQVASFSNQGTQVIKSAARLAVALVVSSQSLVAQDKHPMLDMNAAMKMAEQLFNPAEFAVLHRKELALSDDQVKSLDSLSGGANHVDIMDMARPSTEESAMDEMLMDTSIPINEDLIRKGTQARVEREIKAAVDRARRDRQVASVLTGLQHVVWGNLRMAMFTDAMSATSGKKQ